MYQRNKAALRTKLNKAQKHTKCWAKSKYRSEDLILAHIDAMRKEGWSWIEIAVELGVSQSTAMKWGERLIPPSLGTIKNRERFMEIICG